MVRLLNDITKYNVIGAIQGFYHYEEGIIGIKITLRNYNFGFIVIYFTLLSVFLLYISVECGSSSVLLTIVFPLRPVLHCNQNAT